MYDLFEILRRAQGGAAMDNLARQFGLSTSQMQRAAEAFLPALTLGLQHTALMDPMGFATLFWRAAQPPGTTLFDTPGQAFSAAGREQGDIVLGQLFGSSRAGPQIAQRASAATGIGNEIMRQMLPIVAGLIVAGMMHAAMNQGSGDVLARLGALVAPPAPAPQPATPLPLQVMAPWTAFMNAFLGQPAAAAPEPKAPAATAPSADLVVQMFQAGVQAQDQYVQGLRGLLETFWSAPRPS